MSDLISDRWYYANTAAGFLEDAKKDGYIANLLSKRFEENKKRDVPISLLHSWETSPIALASALEKGLVKREEIVILEYCIDANHRVDAVICGYEKDIPTAVFVETKQWNEMPMRECNEKDYLEMKFNHGWIQVEHPSAQVARYRDRMNELLTQSDIEPNLRIIPYSFLHNCYLLSPEQLVVLRGKKFGELFNKIPIYTGMGARALGNRIHERTRHQKGIDVLKLLEKI